MPVIETSPVVTPIEVAEPNEAQRILLAARDLIADESRWCEGKLEKDGRFCAIGAVGYALGARNFDDEGTHARRVARSPAGPFLIRASQEVIDDGLPEISDVTSINDQMGHIAVMRMFNRAIELAGA